MDNNDNNIESLNNEKKNNIASAIIAIIIIGILLFFTYKFFIEVGNAPSAQTNQGNSDQSSSDEKKEKELNRIANEKYNMLYAKHNYLTNNFIFFQDKDVDINNISNQDKLSILYSFMSDEDKNKTGVHSDTCFLNKGNYTKETYPDTCPKETFDKSILQEKLKNNFDNNMKVDFTDFFATTTVQCFINNSTYTCYLNSSDYTINDYTTIMKYDSVNQTDNGIEIYNYLLTVRKYPSSGYSKGIYSNASATNKIDDLPYEIGDTITQELTDNLTNQYKDRITKYKSIFIKVNGKYLWQKTEIVK